MPPSRGQPAPPGTCAAAGGGATTVSASAEAAAPRDRCSRRAGWSVETVTRRREWPVGAFAAGAPVVAGQILQGRVLPRSPAGVGGPCLSSRAGEAAGRDLPFSSSFSSRHPPLRGAARPGAPFVRRGAGGGGAAPAGGERRSPARGHGPAAQRWGTRSPVVPARPPAARARRSPAAGGVM